MDAWPHPPFGTVRGEAAKNLSDCRTGFQEAVPGRLGQDAVMLLKHLYRISLEEPPHGCFFMGVGRETDNMLDGLRIERLDAYIEQRPEWFRAFNSEPQASQIHRGDGVPARPDIRLATHREAVQGAR
jgi:hypothetical protein